MEEKIVGNKKEDLPSLDLFHSLIPISSLTYRSIYLVCLRSTTPLWFTDKCMLWCVIGFGNPLFFAVLSFKTVACFNPDTHASNNLTFSAGVLRLKCRQLKLQFNSPKNKLHWKLKTEKTKTLKIIQFRTVVTDPGALINKCAFIMHTTNVHLIHYKCAFIIL